MKITTFFLFTLVLVLSSFLLTDCSKSGSSAPVYPIDCSHQLAGAYIGSDYCNSTGQPAYPCNITAIDSTNINLSNLGGVPVTAILDCGKNAITIPSQTFVGNFSMSGTGTYTANRIIINWSGLSLGIPFNCSTTLTR